MDDLGVDVQVLSLSTPGVQILSPGDSVSVARDSNNALAELVMANPRAFKRLQPSQPRYRRQPLTNWSVRQPGLGFPGAMIFGCTGKANADDRQFDPLYATAERLCVPLYLHPQTPIESVMQAYYAGFGKQVDYMFGTYGLGWYYDNGVQLLRLIFSGVFDRYPDTGHCWALG